MMRVFFEDDWKRVKRKKEQNERSEESEEKQLPLMNDVT